MHIPSERIYHEMRSEEGGGAWFVPANGGDEAAVLIKAPTSTLKALLCGSALSFVFGTKDGYLCCGVRIYDVPEAPILLCHIQLHEEEHYALRKIANEGHAPVFLFNEIDVCVAWSDGNITEHSHGNHFSKFIEIPEGFHVGKFDERASTILDLFCTTMDINLQVRSSDEIKVIEIPIGHGPWTSNTISFTGAHDSHTIRLEDMDEGGVLEKAVWASLGSAFPLTLHKSPQVQIGKKQRELTDVLAYYEYGSFLIEAKDLSIFSSGITRTRERRVLGIQKQTKKAIDQLIGASKTVKRGETITDSNGNILPVVSDKPIHCIILLTELMHEGDWREIVALLCEAMIETRDFFHVIDLRELVALLKYSRGKAELLDYNLLQRCEHFAESKTVHIRSRIAAS